jgi:hypothetical protein
MSKNLIPHQLHLTQKQIHALTSGKSSNLPFRHMGSGAGNVVVMLHPQNSRKMITAYKKGKGMRLILSPEEIHHSHTHGRGFNVGKALKNVGREIKHTFTSPKAMNTYKTIGHYALHNALPAITSGASMALGDETGISGAMAGNYLADTIGKKVGMGKKKYVHHDKEIVEDIHERMARLRSMRGKHKGKGLFKTLHKAGIKGVKSKVKDLGKHIVKEGSKAVGKAVGAYLGNEAIGEKLGEALGHAGHNAIEHEGIHHGISALKEHANEIADEAVGMAKSHMGMGQSQRRARGRPRKGTGVSMSKAYMQAMSNNFDGLRLNNMANTNQPLRDYNVNPKVRPSSTEMSMSPYQKPNSPAMNPFIPVSYTQEGGMTPGYAGRGRPRKHQPLEGSGLYGGGLYGP